MHKALEPTQDPGWVLSHEGYNPLTESAVESRFAFGNGFLGMRAARAASRGPTWVGFLGWIKWASWPRCYLAGLFDVPNTEPPVPALVPVADWSRVRILLDGEPLLAREGKVLLSKRKLDMRRGILLSAWTHRTPTGITATGQELRLLSLADRAAGLQFLWLSLDRDSVDVRLEASFAMAGLGMEPTRLEEDVGAWCTEGTRRGVAMAGAATLRLDDHLLGPERPFRCVGPGTGTRSLGRSPSSIESWQLHGLIHRRMIPFLLPALLSLATAHWAGAKCWLRTRLPGMRAGSRAT
jgi:hypothetical protein